MKYQFLANESAETPAKPIAVGSEPKQERGRQRVAAILEAGTAVFGEKGYDAATMTEIAAISGTAIGSLYRFFPSKDALADALLARYTQQLTEGFAELEQQLPHMTLDGVAAALVDFMVALQAQRSVAVSLADARGGSMDRRTELRQALRGGLSSVLCKAVPGLGETRARMMAVVVAQIFKGVSGAAQEQPAVQAALLSEMRELVRVYLASVRDRLVE
jgi:AcrR family transcriptional regulator